MSLTDAPLAMAADEFAARWAAWHREHETRRADPHGFLAVTGLHWLTDRPQRLAGVPGRGPPGRGGPLVPLEPGEDLAVDGRPVEGEPAFGPIAGGGGRAATAGDVVVEVARRGGHDIV